MATAGILPQSKSGTEGSLRWSQAEKRDLHNRLRGRDCLHWAVSRPTVAYNELNDKILEAWDKTEASQAVALLGDPSAGPLSEVGVNLGSCH